MSTPAMKRPSDAMSGTQLDTASAPGEGEREEKKAGQRLAPDANSLLPVGGQGLVGHGVPPWAPAGDRFCDPPSL